MKIPEPAITNQMTTDPMPVVAELQEICRATLQACSSSFLSHEIVASFYPYIGLTHTIRRRGQSWVIRVSDHCAQAHPEVLKAIVTLLACKILRRKPPSEARHIYERFRRDPEVEDRLRARRLQRGRKQIIPATGRHHSLENLYRELNRLYFNNQVEIRGLGWGARKSWRRLGHYDPVHHTITISPVLDSPRVPKLAVSYLLYHEMLHTLFNGSPAKQRERHHTPEFNRAERAFPDYAAARRFLDRFCQTRGRGA